MVKILHVAMVSLAPTQAVGVCKDKTRSHIQRAEVRIRATCKEKKRLEEIDHMDVLEDAEIRSDPQ